MEKLHAIWKIHHSIIFHRIKNYAVSKPVWISLKIICLSLVLLNVLGSQGPLFFFFFHCLVFFFFNLVFYSRIIALQNFVVFCQNSKLISHRNIYIFLHFSTSRPSPSSYQPSRLIQSPCLSFLSHTANFCQLSILHTVM